VLEVDFTQPGLSDAAAGGAGGTGCKWAPGLLFPPPAAAAAAAARLGRGGYVARRIAVASGPVA
jgi:hypothetical protein